MSSRALYLIKKIIPWPRDLRRLVYQRLTWLDIAMVYEAMTGEQYGDSMLTWGLSVHRNDELSRMLYLRVNKAVRMLSSPPDVHPHWVPAVLQLHVSKDMFVIELFKRGRGMETFAHIGIDQYAQYATQYGTVEDVARSVQPGESYICSPVTWRETIRMGARVHRHAWYKILESSHPCEYAEIEKAGKVARVQDIVVCMLYHCKTLNWAFTWMSIDEIHNIAMSYHHKIAAIGWILQRCNEVQRALLLAKKGYAHDHIGDLKYCKKTFHRNMTWDVMCLHSIKSI